jgi:flagellar motor switch protein FliM
MIRGEAGESDRVAAATPEQLRALRALHEEMPAALAAALADMTRSRLEVQLAAIDQMAYGQFVGTLPTPSCFNVLKAESLGDRAALDVELAILYPMLDRMLGGGLNEAPPRRALSDIELPLAGRVVRAFLDGIEQAWRKVLTPKLDVIEVASQARRLRLLPSEEMVAIVPFVVTLDERRGTIRLCIPSRAARRIADKMSATTITRADDGSTEVVATLPGGRITAGQLRGLKPGDIIATDVPADGRDGVTVSVDGRPAFRGKPGAFHSRKAVVLSPLPAEEPSTG